MTSPGIRFERFRPTVPDDALLKVGYPSNSALIYRAGATELAVLTADAGGVLTDRIKVKAWSSPAAIVLNEVGGNVYIGDNSNASMNQGLTINQGTFDTEILALKSSDVAHGMTAYAETDTFGQFLKVSVTGGGATLRGLRNSGSVAVRVEGFGTTEDLTKATSSVAAVAISGAKKSGTSVTSLAANGNLVAFQDNGITRALIDVEGDLHLDGTSTPLAWDDFDDVALVTAYRAATMPEDSRDRKSTRLNSSHQ